MTFFDSLVKPDWIPPDWAFPAAWFTLWTLQLFALLIVAVAPSSNTRSLALALMAAQFITAVMWQAVIFGPGRLAFAAWWLVVVLALVVAATLAAWRVHRSAGLLVAPTIIWVSVATALGFALLRLNPGA